MFSWPGVQKPLDQYGSESGAKQPPAKEEADDDDFDLFGSDVSYIHNHLTSSSSRGMYM